MFQSHLGSILPSSGCLVSEGDCPVSIPPWFDFAKLRLVRIRSRKPGFNPTLVRFCLVQSRAAGSEYSGFNPTLVRFCRDGARTSTQCTCGFNPTLVRFCPNAVTCLSCSACCFNPTLVRFCLTAPALPSAADYGFNPTLVRFCPCAKRFRTCCATSVSIPPWFDFAVSAGATGSGAGDEFQSHLGSILPWAQT